MRMHHIDLNQMYIGGDWGGGRLSPPKSIHSPPKIIPYFPTKYLGVLIK